MGGEGGYKRHPLAKESCVRRIILSRLGHGSRAPWGKPRHMFTAFFVSSSIWHEYVGMGACAAQKLKNSVLGSLDVAGAEWGTHRATMKGPPGPSPGVLMEGGCLGPGGGKRNKKIELAGFYRRTPKNENGKPFSFFRTVVLVNWKIVLVNWKVVLVNWKIVLVNWKVAVVN